MKASEGDTRSGQYLYDSRAPPHILYSNLWHMTHECMMQVDSSFLLKETGHPQPRLTNSVSDGFWRNHAPSPPPQVSAGWNMVAAGSAPAADFF